MAWRGCWHGRGVCDAIHRRGGRWPIRGNSRGPYRTVAIGGGLRPCWPSDSRAWSSTVDGSGCVARDRTVVDSSGTYVVGNSLACKPESDRLATRTTGRIKRRRPKGRRSEKTRKKTIALEPGKKTHAKNSNFRSAESERFQLGGGSPSASRQKPPFQVARGAARSRPQSAHRPRPNREHEAQVEV
jgi:hypothetical protein